MTLCGNTLLNNTRTSREKLFILFGKSCFFFFIFPHVNARKKNPISRYRWYSSFNNFFFFYLTLYYIEKVTRNTKFFHLFGEKKIYLYIYLLLFWLGKKRKILLTRTRASNDWLYSWDESLLNNIFFVGYIISILELGICHWCVFL